MKFLLNLSILLSLSLASPVTQLQPRRAFEAHPAVGMINNLNTQLQSVVQQLEQYHGDGDRVATITTIFQQSQLTLTSLERATNSVTAGPDLNFWTGTSFAIPTVALGITVHRFANILRTQRKALDAVRASPMVFRYLQQARSDADQFGKAIVEKMTPALGWIAKGIAKDVVATLAGIETEYKPEGGELSPEPQQFQGQGAPSQEWQPSALPPQEYPSNGQGIYTVQLGSTQ